MPPMIRPSGQNRSAAFISTWNLVAPEGLRGVRPPPRRAPSQEEHLPQGPRKLPGRFRLLSRRTDRHHLAKHVEPERGTQRGRPRRHQQSHHLREPVPIERPAFPLRPVLAIRPPERQAQGLERRLVLDDGLVGGSGARARAGGRPPTRSGPVVGRGAGAPLAGATTTAEGGCADFSAAPMTAARSVVSEDSRLVIMMLSTLRAKVKTRARAKVRAWVFRLYHPATRSIESLNQVSTLSCTRLQAVRALPTSVTVSLMAFSASSM